MANIKILTVVGLVVLAIGVLLHIIGLATPVWSYTTNSGIVLSAGLWKVCLLTCVAWSDTTDEMKVSEAFAIIGMLASMGGMLLAFIYFLTGLMGKPQNKMLAVFAAAACGFAAICILICVVTWAVEVNDILSEATLGYSFGLSIAGGILVVVGGALVFASSTQSSVM